MTVTKRNVEMFDLLGQHLSRDEALQLYEELAQALGVPAFRLQGCTDRMSHGAHWHGNRQRLYCTGLRFDQT